jgi:hypothetical protein
VSQEIAATRAELARDVDRLARRASPRRLLARFTGGLRTAKDRTVRTSEDAASTLADASAGFADRLHGVGDAVRQAPTTVARATGDSPIGVGLMAFGGGVLAAALIPESQAERRAAHELSRQARPTMVPVQQAGQALAADVRQTIEAAGEQIKAAADDAAGHIRSAAEQGGAAVRAAASEVMGQPATGSDLNRDGSQSR